MIFTLMINKYIPKTCKLIINNIWIILNKFFLCKSFHFSFVNVNYNE